jgi:hypothetical protein
MAAVRRLPVAPLLAIDRAELARLIGPFVPDAHPLILQPAHVGVAAQEPQQLDDDRAQVQLLGGQHRKALRQVEAHLRPEHRQGAGAGPVHLLRATGEHAVHEIEILTHQPLLPPRLADAKRPAEAKRSSDPDAIGLLSKTWAGRAG